MRFLRRTVALLTAVTAVGVLQPAAASAVGRQTATSPQTEIEAYLRTHPGGVQVSDNAVAYRAGAVVVVFPDRGQRRAPDGLGRNVRLATATANGVELRATAYRRGCPYSTLTSADWYCFYTDVNWGGRRLQFRDTCRGYASDWGFNNQTSSWVNTNGRKTVYAYNSSAGGLLWVEPTGISESSWVGSTANDRMSYWRVYGGGC